MRPPVIPLILLVLALASPALAQVPRTMSYQGVLTDAAGTPLPDGTYDLTFRIYAVPVSGTALYAEAHTGASAVQLKKGGFSVILGSITPLTLAFDQQYYLGIQVGADPELAPRVQLASSPYALGLALPFQCAEVGGAKLLEGLNYSIGGAIHTYDGGGLRTLRLEPDLSGGGAGWLQVTRNGQPSVNGFIVDGNTGSGEPAAMLVGSARSVTMDMGQAGNGSVQMPADAVDATELFNEPGIAQNHVSGQVNLVNGTMVDIVTVTITIPEAGYIVVEADAQHGFSGNASASNRADVQIDETAGGAIDASHYFRSGNSVAANGVTWSPLSVRRTYFKSSAGSYTFRLEAEGTISSGLTAWLWNPTITATYVPTSYGIVTTATSVAEATQFEKVERTRSDSTHQPGGESLLVDLRELELRAAKAREAAAAAERDLLQARTNAQLRRGDTQSTEPRR